MGHGVDGGDDFGGERGVGGNKRSNRSHVLGRDGAKNDADRLRKLVQRDRRRRSNLRRSGRLSDVVNQGCGRDGAGQLHAGLDQDRAGVRAVDIGLDGAADTVDDDASDTISADAIFNAEDRATDTDHAGGGLDGEHGKGVKFTGLADNFSAEHFELGHGRTGVFFDFTVGASDTGRGDLTESADLQ